MPQNVCKEKKKVKKDLSIAFAISMLDNNRRTSNNETLKAKTESIFVFDSVHKTKVRKRANQMTWRCEHEKNG